MDRILIVCRSGLQTLHTR